VTRADKLLDQILRGTSDNNILFSGMQRLLAKLGFQERIKGSITSLRGPASRRF
jgi:hypothetical protein